MTTYTEGGRLRKQCPKCKVYVHSRTLMCPACEHEFVAGAKAKVEAKQQDNEVITKYSEAGRGKKLCPDCTTKAGSNVYVGCRIQKCSCDFDFAAAKAAEPEVIKTKERLEAEALMEALGYQGMKILYVNAGDPPIAMKDYDENSVFEWAEDVLTHYYSEGYFASAMLMRWQARHLAPADKLKQVLNSIQAWQAQYTPEAELV